MGVKLESLEGPAEGKGVFSTCEVLDDHEDLGVADFDVFDAGSRSNDSEEFEAGSTSKSVTTVLPAKSESIAREVSDIPEESNGREEAEVEGLTAADLRLCVEVSV